MLKTRVITAVVLLAILLPVLFLRQMALFGVVVMLFFAAAVWEAYRLVQPHAKYAKLMPVVWTLVFALPILGPALGTGERFHPMWWWAAAALAWLLLFLPLLKTGLPPLEDANWCSHGLLYMLSLVAAFMGLVALYAQSTVYLLSVLVVVWVADIGAYFSGKAFGKHKLAPSISPGKSWEGAIGGCIMVIVLAVLWIVLMDRAPWLADTFAVHVAVVWGWGGLILVLVGLVAFSIAGDLAESQLKRRAGLEDSSNLLPGHGGVLDRIDALVPVLPLAALIERALNR